MLLHVRRALVLPALAAAAGLTLVSAAAVMAVETDTVSSFPRALWWALALAVLWWLVAAGVMVAVRQGTPGMLLAGIQFSATVAPARIAAVLPVALATAATLGLPAAVGPPGWALTAAAGSDITATVRDGS